MCDSFVDPRTVGRGSIYSGSSASDLSETISDMSLSTSPGSDMPTSVSNNNMTEISTNVSNNDNGDVGKNSTTISHPRKKRVMRQLSSNPYLTSSEISPDDQTHPVILGANSYGGESSSDVFDSFYFSEESRSSATLGFRANSYPLSSEFITNSANDSQDYHLKTDLQNFTQTSVYSHGNPDSVHNSYHHHDRSSRVDFDHEQQPFINSELDSPFHNGNDDVANFPPPFHPNNTSSQPRLLSQYEIDLYKRFEYNNSNPYHHAHSNHSKNEKTSPAYNSETANRLSQLCTPSHTSTFTTSNNNGHHHRCQDPFIPNAIPASESCPSTPPHFNDIQLRHEKERHQSEGDMYSSNANRHQHEHKPQSREINSWGHFSKHTEKHYKYRRSHCNSSDSDEESQRFYRNSKPFGIPPDKSQSESRPNTQPNKNDNLSLSIPDNCNHHSHNKLPSSSSSVLNNKSSRVAFSKNQSEFSANDRLSNFNGVKPQVFKDRFQFMKRWFADCNDGQKNVILKGLLKLCDLPQLHLLSVHMSRELHHGCPSNCEDILTWLPPTLATKVMTYLDPVSLCQAAQVCSVWRSLAEDQSLWRRFCCQAKWRLSKAAEHKQVISHMSAEGSIQWKNVFAERFRLRNNWLKGRRTVRTFEGHHQGISCVQFDDSRIVSGSSDKTIKVWNMRTNAPWSVQTLMGHHGTVRCLHLEGNRLVSGSCDTTIKVWDLSTEESWSSIACKVTMTGHSDTVRCLQADDDKVISGSYDKTLKIWDLKSGELRQTLRGHQGSVLCVHFSETKIVSGSVDKTIKVWNHEGSCMNTLCGHQDAVTCLMFDSTRIVSGSLDHNLKFWDVHSGECLNTIDWKMAEGHTGVVRCLQADSWRLVSAGDDKTIKVWNLSTGERLVTLRDHTDGVTCLQFNDFIIVSGSYDKTVKLWDFSCC